MDPLPYPHPTDARVSERMRKNPRRDTAPEIALRRVLHARGLRFRKDLPIRTVERVVRPDVVFTRARVAVFLDGCFWHCCPLHGNIPRANTEYWQPKLARNVMRDRQVDAALTAAGWSVVRGWEHEQPEAVANQVEAAIAAARQRSIEHQGEDHRPDDAADA